MPYLNVDDGMDEHPKVEGLSDAAFRMHLSAMFYAARRGTDGVVTRLKARRLSDTSTDVVAAELVGAGVWHDIGEGCGSRTCLAGVPGAYVIHDYLQWNHSADWWTQRSKDQAAKGSVGMHRRWHTNMGEFREDCRHCQADNTGYSGSNIKPVTEPEPEPEPESIASSHRPALANPSRRGTTEPARDDVTPTITGRADDASRAVAP